MKASDGIKAIIKSMEGCKLTAYKCPAGVPTIGYGHTKNVRMGQTITQQQADKFLDEDLEVFENHINAKKLNINQHQFDAMVSLCYNIGPGNFDKSSVLRLAKVNPNDPKIHEAFLMWNKAGGKVLAGLTRRRTAEADWYFSK